MFFKNLLTDKRFWKSTLILAIPSALQNLLSNSASLVDILMIGKLGDDTISAVGMASQIAFLNNLFLFGIISGGSVFVSQFWGAGNMRGIKRTYGIILANCILVSFLFFSAAFFAPELCIGFFTNDKAIIEIGARYLKYAAFSYFGISLTMGFSCVLQSTEQVRIPLYSNIIAVLTNVFFNYVLINGKLGFPLLGIEGAAIATILSSVINPIIIILLASIKKSIIIAPPNEVFSFSLIGLKGFYKIALPVILNEVLWGLGMTVYNSIFGHMSSELYPSITITKTVMDIVFVVFVGLCNSCAVQVGKQVGERNFDRAKTYAKRFLFLIPFFGFILGMLVIALRGSILSLFSVKESVRDTTMLLLMIYGLNLPIRNIQYISIVGIFRAGGDTRTGLLYDIGILWGIGIPITFICGILLRLDFALIYFLMLSSEDIPKSILCLRYFFSMKWVKPVAQNTECEL